MSALTDAKSETVHVPSVLSSHARNDLERRLVRKLDLHLSVIVLLYALNYVSLSFLLLCAYPFVRSTERMLGMLRIFILVCMMSYVVYSSARLGGFEKDLHLHGTQYATILSIVYAGFSAMQVPA